MNVHTIGEPIDEVVQRPHYLQPFNGNDLVEAHVFTGTNEFKKARVRLFWQCAESCGIDGTPRVVRCELSDLHCAPPFDWFSRQDYDRWIVCGWPQLDALRQRDANMLKATDEIDLLGWK